MAQMPRNCYHDSMRYLTVLILALGAAAGCAGKSSFAGVELASVDGSKSVPLDQCPTPKCLTVYVAPWCPYCVRSTGIIRNTRESLRARNVSTRVIVGMDQPESLRSYARDFGGDTLLDPQGLVKVSGVPHFIVSGADGTVEKTMAGAPQSPDDIVAWVLQN